MLRCQKFAFAVFGLVHAEVLSLNIIRALRVNVFGANRAKEGQISWGEEKGGIHLMHISMRVAAALAWVRLDRDADETGEVSLRCISPPSRAEPRRAPRLKDSEVIGLRVEIEKCNHSMRVQFSVWVEYDAPEVMW